MNLTGSRNCRAVVPPATTTADKALTLQIKQRAHELGFDLVGITTATSPPHAGEFQQWLANGFHGEMNYLARNAAKRINPQQVLPEAKSIIVVGMNYYTTTDRALTEQRPPESDAPSLPNHRVARYAAGARDYHDTMGEKLKELAALVDGPWYVDTGPLLERDLAQRAGIGWIGKHTNLINRSLGNWFFLGAVLTKLELTADEPASAHCGKCSRCIAVCPTGAIVAPYRLDARRCISYLTIELKGRIPVDLRSKIGNHLFGCDDCLEMCPWNRFARPAVTTRELPALTEMLAWTEQQFADFFRGTPVYRLKRARFLRNVCVVLGNTGDETVLPSLARACQDGDALLREHAKWGVEEICRRGGSRSAC